nr:V protein [avian paramyxovirus 1]
MATFTDAEIDELFETSGTVIDSIITAQGKPVETVGRSAIPQGKTKALSLAWEKHGNTNTPAAQEPAGEQDQHGQNQASNSNRATSEEGLHSSQAQAATQPQEDANESQLKTGASSSLLSMLDKLSNKSSNAKKGPTSDSSTADPPLQREPCSGTNPTWGQSGEDSAGNGAPGRPKPWTPGHRREHSISWTTGGVTTISWCNPACSPIRAEPRQYSCVCGSCPATCRLCAGDDVYDGGDLTEGKQN